MYVLLGVIYVTLNKKKNILRVFHLKNFCSPEMSCRGMVILKHLRFSYNFYCSLVVEAVETRQG